MNTKKLGTVVVLVLLALGVSWLLPGVAGAGRERSLVQRVEALEGQVALLTARVAELEEGGGSCACSCDVLHLTPLADFPAEPSDGDVCMVTTNATACDLYYYLDGNWLAVRGYPLWTPSPPP